MEQPLVNRVANSELITLNLEDHYPAVEFLNFDLKDHLFQGLILKEKDFRQILKEFDWETVEGKVVLVYCSTDAIIPVWAYMLVAAHAESHAITTYLGDQEAYLTEHYHKIIGDLDGGQYQDERIIIKGCSQRPVPASAYVALTEKLKPYAQSIMYGEPCSTVPIFKRPRAIRRKD